MKDKESLYMEIRGRKIPFEAIEKLEKLEKILNVRIKSKEKAREKAINQICDSMMVIEYSGGSVVWEIEK